MKNFKTFFIPLLAISLLTSSSSPAFFIGNVKQAVKERKAKYTRKKIADSPPIQPQLINLEQFDEIDGIELKIDRENVTNFVRAVNEKIAEYKKQTPIWKNSQKREAYADFQEAIDFLLDGLYFIIRPKIGIESRLAKALEAALLSMRE